MANAKKLSWGKDSDMVCPNCRHAIVWLKVATISRWTNVRCGNCQHEWSRGLDLQFWVICLLLCGGVFLVFVTMSSLVELWGVNKGIGAGLLLGLVWYVILTYIDARTINLMPPANRQRTT